MKDLKNLLVSFSGGRTSALMCKFVKEHPRYKDWDVLFVFANTGREREETLEFVNECDKRFNLNLVWIEADINPKKGVGTNYKIVSFETAERIGTKNSLFEQLIKKNGLPSKLWRHCTRDLKETPIHKYAKKYFGSKYYFTALGIRADEKHRISSDPKKVYPLAELNIDEKFVRGWWKKQDFDLKLKDYEGNCDLCFLKSKRKKLTILLENPTISKWWRNLEETYATEEQPLFDVYRNLSIQDLVSEANEITLGKRKFRKQLDKEEEREIQSIFFEPEYDLEFDCFCKSN
jgi:3'-phosphoadenosine 5'-phosphosulfate sulfotransferase (PAPS reductase)/FAD synthetase